MNDSSFIQIGFTFEGRNYFSLLRKKVKGSTTEYHVTVMNGELEKLLYGNHVILETDGVLQIDQTITNQQQAVLKLCITKALYKYLHISKEQSRGLSAKH